MHSRVRAQALATAILATTLAWTHSATAQTAAATDLAVRVTATTFTVGKNGTYFVTVANGGGAATNVPVVLTDPLPAGLSLVSGGGGGWTCSANGSFVTCVNETPLVVGASSSFPLTVSVCTAAFPTVQNSITVQYPNDTNPANNTATRSTSVRSGVCIPSPTPTAGTPTATRTSGVASTPTSTQTPVPAATDLLLSKTVSGTFAVGSNGSYALTVTNLGPATTNTLITVTDPLPNGLGFVAASGAGWTCTANGQTVICGTSSPLAPLSSTRVTLTVSVGSAAYPTTTNIATLSYAGDTNPANNTARRPTSIRLGTGAVATATSAPALATTTPTQTPTPANVAAADVSLTKNTGSLFVTGRNAFYVLVVGNAGPATTNAPIAVTDVLPNGLGYVSATGTGWNCSVSAQTVICTNANPLAAGSTTSLQLTVSVGAAAYPTTTNTATVSYAGDTNPSNNLAHRATTIRLGTAAPVATDPLRGANRLPHRPEHPSAPQHPRPAHRAVSPAP